MRGSCAALALVLISTPAQQPQRPVVESGTTLVHVTIVARDRKGAFAGGLTAGDFTVTENGTPVTPRFFREIDGTPPPVTPAPSPANTFSNATGGAPHSVTVIVLDRLNTRWSDQARTREQLRIFFAKLRPDDRVAIYALDGAALRVLVDFTSDPSVLIETINGSARLTSSHLDAGSGPIAELMTTIAANTTVTALQTIGQHLASVPGRKNIVWVSPGFNVYADTQHGVSVNDAMRTVTEALNTAQISLYGIDPAGVPDVFGNVTATTTTFASGLSSNQDVKNHDAVQAFAEDTGGKAFFNNNDIAGSVRTAIDDANQHYELQYTSPAPANDGRYREIRVTTRRPGLELQYRHGYFATAAEAPGGDRKIAIGRAIGSPLAATGIPLEVTPRNMTAGGGVELSVHADGAALMLSPDRGTWSGGIDLSIAQVRPDGTTEVDVDTTIALHLTDAQHAAIVQDGLTLTKTLTVAADAARVAVVVRDAKSGAIGSVVIPANRLRPAR